jgi:uncharacterized protein (TIGR02145 family)
MKKNNRLCLSLSVFFTLSLLSSCVSTTTPEIPPVLSTSNIRYITQTSAWSGGTIASDGSSKVIIRGVCWSTKTSPTIADSKTSDGSGLGHFNSIITGLTAGTTYFVRVYATSSASTTTYGETLSFTTTLLITFNPNLTYGTLTDIDGNIYKTITIGTQTWMAENLRTTKYRDGTTIPNVTGYAWTSLSTGAWCNYNDDASYDLKYGKLYNWYAATNSHNIAPTGWHVPTDVEWTTLTNFLGGEYNSYPKLKEIGTGNWNYSQNSTPSNDGTNTSGFTALPSGLRYMSSGSFSIDGSCAYWWSSTLSGSPLVRYLSYNPSWVVRDTGSRVNGFSVRCVKD